MAQRSPRENEQLLENKLPVNEDTWSPDLAELQLNPVHKTSIFDIPIIMDSICDHLSKQDLKNCLIVSKEWQSVFGVYYWESVDWVDARNWNLDEALRNTRLIKYLAIGPSHIELVDDKELTNLIDLNISRAICLDNRDVWHYEFYKDIYDGYEDPVQCDDQGFLVGGDEDDEYESEWSESDNINEYQDGWEEGDESRENDDWDRGVDADDLVEGGRNDIDDVEDGVDGAGDVDEQWYQDVDEPWPAVSTLSLIKQNPGLKYLSIEITREVFPLFFGSRNSPDYSDMRHEDERSVLFALKSHPSIISLDIAPCYYGYSASWDVIIRHCPSETIQHLTISSPPTIHNDDRFWSGVGIRGEETMPSYLGPWPVFPSMKYIGIYPDMNKIKTQILIELLRRCPNLVHFELATIYRDEDTDIFEAIREYCPKLEKIKFNVKDRDLGQGIIRLLGSFCHLKLVSVAFYDPTNSIIPAILNSSATIESITLWESYNVSSATIATVLQICPNLRKFYLGYSRASKYGVTLLDFVRTPWLSSNINELDLDIVLSCPDIQSDINPPTQEEIIELLVELSLKLKQAGNPTSWFRWCTEVRSIPPEVGLALVNERISEHRLSYMRLDWKIQEKTNK
ncbi:hypothetical protein BGZ76_010647 [Entomortierella beljakovae]|nr:hypothetical protein BGZ76_010647 [Entomortierella beljakovae]